MTTEGWIKESDAQFNWAETERSLIRIHGVVFGIFGFAVVVTMVWYISSARKDDIPIFPDD